MISDSQINSNLKNMSKEIILIPNNKMNINREKKNFSFCSKVKGRKLTKVKQKGVLLSVDV